MEFKDFIVTPITITVILIFAYILKPIVTTPETKRYFLPALYLKMAGAIALGFIYQFYYGGGDTLNFYFHGSVPIWEAFLDSPEKGIQIIFANGIHRPETFEYSSRIWFFRDAASFTVIQVASIFGLFTFNTYSSIAILFAVFSFSGSWAMYRAILRFYPQLHKTIAIAIFFIPSVVFWGSGVMKDTLTLGALGWLVFAIVKIFFERKQLTLSFIILLSAAYLIYSIKIYIILCFIPAGIIWIGFDQIIQIKNTALKALLFPFIITLVVGGGYFTIRQVGKGHERYSLDNIATSAEVTARWINHVSELDEGSGYTLGDFDYSPAGISRKVLPAIFTTLFQPFIWQATNPIFLLSALEANTLLLLTLWILFNGGWRVIGILLRKNSLFLFCMIFSISFAAAVGLSTYNFGSLVRYKIPLLPLYGITLSLLHYYSVRALKLPQRAINTISV